MGLPHSGHHWDETCFEPVGLDLQSLLCALRVAGDDLSTASES